MKNGDTLTLKFNKKCHLPQGGVSLSNLKPEIIFKVTPYGCHSQTSNLKWFQGDTLWVSFQTSNLKWFSRWHPMSVTLKPQTWNYFKVTPKGVTRVSLHELRFQVWGNLGVTKKKNNRTQCTSRSFATGHWLETRQFQILKIKNLRYFAYKMIVLSFNCENMKFVVAEKWRV